MLVCEQEVFLKLEDYEIVIKWRIIIVTRMVV